MREVREKQFGEHKVKFFELTVAEVRNWFSDMEIPEQTDAVDMLLFEEITLPDLYRITDLTRETADDMTPSELEAVIAEAKEVNRIFFATLARVMTPFQRALTEAQAAAS